MFDWFHQLTDPAGLRGLLQGTGLILLVVIVFAETGILAGFFLPGDSLLLTAGVLCAIDPTRAEGPPVLDLLTTGVALSAAAIAGDALNFHLGRLAGTRVWTWPDGRFFKRAHLVEAHDFYQRWGGLAIAGGRFIPIIRTFVPFIAGVSRMPYATFVLWNIGGALAWIWSMLLLGWALGQNEVMRRNLHYLVLAVVVLSFIPVAIGVWRRWRNGPGPDQGKPAAD